MRIDIGGPYRQAIGLVRDGAQHVVVMHDTFGKASGA